jgi:hypothetical protein
VLIFYSPRTVLIAYFFHKTEPRIANDNTTPQMDCLAILTAAASC